MDETIGVKGGHNDRRRSIIIGQKNKKKLEEHDEERYIRELEKKVKRQQKISLIKTLPIAIAGKTFVTIYNIQHVQSDDNENRNKKDLDYENGIDDYTPNNLTDKKDGIKRERKVIIDKTTGKKTVVYVPIDENNRTLLEDLIYQEKKNNEQENNKEKDILEKSNADILLTGENTKKLETLKARRIVDQYEKELKDIRYELRKLIAEYYVLNDESNNLVVKEDAEKLFDKLTVLIEKIELLKQKIKIDDLDKYDDNYIYILVEEYLKEFRNNNFIGEIKDSPLYVMISSKLDELDVKKDELDSKVRKKKDELALKEEKFDELMNRYYSIDRLNNELLEFQNSQDMLLKELKEKVENAVTVTEKVKIEFEIMNRQNRRLRTMLTFGLLFPGAGMAKGMAASTAAYLYFMNRIIRPKPVTKHYKVVTVSDYSSEINSSINAIDDASRLLNKTCRQIDKMIDQIGIEFKDYLDVVPECRTTLNDLIRIKSQLREKEYEIAKIKEEQKKVLENNNAKVLKRGEYVA